MDRRANEREVADHIKRLVTDGLIVEAIGIVDRNAVIADHQDVAWSEMFAKPGGLQRFCLFTQAVRARGRDIVDVVAFCDVV